MQFKPRRFIPLILSAVLALPALVSAQEPVTITGKVTSDAGQPLGQVEVAIPSMGLGALSKDDGRYAFVVPGARVSGQAVTLVARRLGDKSLSAQVTLSPGGADGVRRHRSTTVTGGTRNNVAGTSSTTRGADINPSDIASYDILEGPSAAAIYGARAGQGVVLITTKSGTPGPTRTTFRSELLLNNVTNGPALQTRYGQGSEGNAATCAARGCSLSSGSWGAALAAGTPVYDHFHELFRTGAVTDNTLTVSGGDQKSLFYLSGEYLY